MTDILHDLRLVKLALHLETTIEALERDLRDRIPVVPVRAKLRGLFEDGPGHHALRKEAKRLAEQAMDAQTDLTTHDILATLMDCETLAHEFYMRHMDDVSSPGLVAIFSQLAREEAQHRDLVREAQRLLSHYPVNRRAVAFPDA